MSSVLVAALVAVLSVAPPSDWAQPGYGPGATFYNAAEARLDTQHFAKKWEILTHGAPDCEVGREPLVYRGNVYTSFPGGIAALDPATGGKRWFTRLVRRGISRMAIADGKLVALTYTCDGQGSFLTAYSATTGARLWEVPIGGPAQDMVVDHGVAVVDTRPDFTLSTTGYRLSDGGRIWRLSGTRGDGLLSSGGRLLLRTGDGGARAVDIGTGSTIWQTRENWYAVGSDPSGTRFYISGAAGALTAVTAASGTVIWKSDLPSPGVTADDRRVYLPRNRSVLCLDATTGRKLWSVHLPDGAGQPVRAGGLLFSPSGMGEPLSIADAVTGKGTMMAAMPSDQHYPPAVAGGRLFLTDGDRLRAYF